MSDFFLPGRSSGPSPRARGNRVSDAGDIPNARVTSDPGLAVPMINPAEGLEEVAEALNEGAELQQATEERIQVRQEAVAKARSIGAYNETIQAEYRRVQTEADLADESAVATFGEFLKSQQKLALSQFQGSDEGRLDLEQRLEGVRSNMAVMAGAASAEAGRNAVSDELTRNLNGLVTVARENPLDLEAHFSTWEAAVDAMSPALSPDEEAKAWVHGREQMVVAAVDSLLADGDWQAAETLIDEVLELKELLSPKAQKSLNAQINAAREREEQETRQHAASDLEIAVRRGESGLDEIEAAYKTGWLTPAKRTQLVALAEAVDHRQADDLAQIERVASALTIGLPLDPGNADDRKAAELHYRNVFLPALDRLPPERHGEAVLDYVSNVGVIPQSVLSGWRRALRDDDAGAKAMVADAIAQVAERNPRILENFDATERRMAMTIAQNLKLGAAATSAVERATDAIHNANEPERKVRIDRLRKEKLLDNAETIIADALAEPDFFSFEFGDAEIPDAVVGEYRTAYEDHYLATGDADAAESLALSDIKRTWAVTRIGPRRLMKYAPERYGVPSLSDEENAEWMAGQLKTELQEIEEAGTAPGAPSGPEVDMEMVRLEADNRTAREAGVGLPSYVVMFTNADGFLEPIFRNGRVMRWRPEWSSSPRHQSMKDEAEKGQADAQRRGRKRREDAKEGVDTVLGGS